MMTDTNASMLLLNGLPERTQISLDAHSQVYLTNQHFAGIKGLPTGWHCITWSIASDSSSSSSSSHCAAPSEASIRSILLRHFDHRDVAIRELDRIQQQLVAPHFSDSASRSHRPERITRSIDPSTRPPATLVTPQVLDGVEPRLLPYPSEVWEPWKKATRHLGESGGYVGRQVVAKVLGVDSVGDSTTDSLATGSDTTKNTKEEETLRNSGNLGREEGGKIIWGRSRAEVEHSEVDLDQDVAEKLDERRSTSRKRSAETDSPQTEQDDNALEFTPFDPRRSYPPCSTGAEITRWTHDKSWLLQHLALLSRTGIHHLPTSTIPEYMSLMCEFELAFLVFLTTHNSHAWEQWKHLVVVFCHSSSLIGAPSLFDSSIAPSETQPDLRAHIAFLSTLQAQLALLPPDFWSTQPSPTEEQSLLKNLDVLRGNIARSLTTKSHTQPQAADEYQREKLIKAWRTLSRSTCTAFTWNLDRRLDEEAEVQDDLEAEQGDDAPVIVDL